MPARSTGYDDEPEEDGRGLGIYKGRCLRRIRRTGLTQENTASFSPVHGSSIRPRPMSSLVPELIKQSGDQT